MKSLIKVVETYRIDSEAEVEQFLAELKEDPRFELAKYSSQKKQKKAKGEIVDEWIRCEVTREFNDEAEPASDVTISFDCDKDFD